MALARDPERNCFVQWDLERRDPWEYNPLLGSIKKLRSKFTELSESARKARAMPARVRSLKSKRYILS